jgi:hypothetical protein
MAGAYPKSKIFGFDSHAPSVETSNRAPPMQASPTVRSFRSPPPPAMTASTISSTSSIACTTWAIRSRPSTRAHLAPGGTVMLVEPFALDGRAKNLAGNPMATLFAPPRRP